MAESCERCKKAEATHQLCLKDFKGERELHLCEDCTDQVVLMETGNMQHIPYWERRRGTV